MTFLTLHAPNFLGGQYWGQPLDETDPLQITVDDTVYSKFSL